MASTMLRVGLTPAEVAEVKRLSETSGVPVARLIADAVRKSLLGGDKQ